MSQKKESEKPSKRFYNIQPLNVRCPQKGVFSAVSLNVSKSGILFVGNHLELPFKVKDNCHISFYQPDMGITKPLELQGTIMRIDPPYQGEMYGTNRHYGVALALEAEDSLESRKVWFDFIQNLSKA